MTRYGWLYLVGVPIHMSRDPLQPDQLLLAPYRPHSARNRLRSEEGLGSCVADSK